MFFNAHVHSERSNMRGFLDSTNRIKDLVTRSHEIGYSGFALTDHDCISAHVDMMDIIKAFKDEDPDSWKDFKVALGNEIYLCNKNEIEAGIYNFYHFILIAKDFIGHEQLQELSTRAWCENGFSYVIPRTPTYYEDLYEVIKANPGHLIASTACLGGFLDKEIIRALEKDAVKPDYSIAKRFIMKMDKVFGHGNFFIELQSSDIIDQHLVNKVLIDLANELDVPFIITTDAHYLKKEDKKIHETFLKSNDKGESSREIGEFYSATYLQTTQEIHEFLDNNIGFENVEIGINNTDLIYNQITDYSLNKPLNIPYVSFDDREPDAELFTKYVKVVPLLDYFYHSEIPSDRHMCRDLLEKMASNPEEFENQETYDAMGECLDAIITSSQAQNTAWSGYLLVCKELIKTAWEAGSLVGPARGSGTGFLLLYMLDITQINPIREETQTYYWRFLHSQRASVLDIDVDTEGSKKDAIIEKLREKYGGFRHVTKVQTVSTCKSRAALQLACRGLGYTPEEGVFLSSFIKSERGINYNLSQTYYGDKDNDIEPDKEFVNLMNNKYPDVWETAIKIEGLCTGVGSHAGGIIISSDDLTKSTALMKTSSGDIVTQYDLHKAEQTGLIKYDLLNIDALEKIHTELNLLLEDKLINWEGSLKETYEKYLGVYNINRKDPTIWDLIKQHKIISLFQFEQQSGWQAIELGQPTGLKDLAALNSVMRLMAQEGSSESPIEVYSRHRKDISQWYAEMREYGLSEDEIKFLEGYCLHNYGLLPNQENFMLIVQDERVGGFDLVYADKLRKSIAKKNPVDFNKLQVEFYKRMEERHLSEKLCHYVWDVLISMNKGYGFNLAHTLSYSIVALQEANLASNFPIEYWNCANLIADSGGQDSTVNYGKIAQAISRMKNEGIDISLPEINKVRFDFHPNIATHEIVYGLKPISGVGAAVANAIVENQPYSSMMNFYEKMQEYKTSSATAKFGDAAMIQLIKAGCFDQLEGRDRQEIMKDFIKTISNPVKSLKLSNILELNELGLLTKEERRKELRYYRFREYIFNKDNLARQDGKSVNTWYYKLDRKFAEPYFYENFESYMTEGKDYEYNEEGYIIVKRGSFDKVYDNLMAPFKKKLNENTTYIDAINENRFQQVWEDKCSGSISKWEMESLSYYYHEHELANVNEKYYNISDFNSLNPKSEIADSYFWRGKSKPRYKLSRIWGTVIDKNKAKNTVSLLTPSGVVTVKFYKGQFTFYDKEVPGVNDEGKKIKLENSWFKRGTMLIITGFRSEENFVAKVYKDSVYKHTVQLIEAVEGDKLALRSTRVDENEKEAKLIAV